MNVYQITSLTLLQCLYTDVDICNQKGKDVFKGTNRPKEMSSIVKSISKIKVSD